MNSSLRGPLLATAAVAVTLWLLAPRAPLLGKPAVTGLDKTVQDRIVTPGFANVKDVVGLAMLALALEDVAAATYLNGIENALQDVGAIKVAASIQPVEMQHSAILHFVLGDYPVPDSFAKTAGARGPDDVIT